VASTDGTLRSTQARAALARAKVLYTDLDGTLLGHGGCVLCDGTGSPGLAAAQAIVDVNRAGLPVVMVSGRNAKQLAEVARLLGWRDYIAELGCLRVYDRGREVVADNGDWPADALLEGETPHDAIARAGALDALTQRFPGRIEVHDPYHLDRVATHVLRGNVDVEEARAALSSLAVPVAFLDNGIIHPPRHTLVGVEEIHAYHLAPAGVSKARAITADLRLRGLECRDAIAIGDSRTDLEMADAVGLMALVANALDDPTVRDVLAAREDVVATVGRKGEGWAELAKAWLAARSD